MSSPLPSECTPPLCSFCETTFCALPTLLYSKSNNANVFSLQRVPKCQPHWATTRATRKKPERTASTEPNKTRTRGAPASPVANSQARRTLPTSRARRRARPQHNSLSSPSSHRTLFLLLFSSFSGLISPICLLVGLPSFPARPLALPIVLGL